MQGFRPGIHEGKDKQVCPSNRPTHRARYVCDIPFSFARSLAEQTESWHCTCTSKHIRKLLDREGAMTCRAPINWGDTMGLMDTDPAGARRFCGVG